LIGIHKAAAASVCAAVFALAPAQAQNQAQDTLKDTVILSSVGSASANGWPTYVAVDQGFFADSDPSTWLGDIDLNCQIGQRSHELGVIRAHTLKAGAVIAPGLVIIPSVIAKRRHQGVQVVPVLAPDMLLDDRPACLSALIIEY
jgi:hypothetical protein